MLIIHNSFLKETIIILFVLCPCLCLIFLFVCILGYPFFTILDHLNYGVVYKIYRYLTLLHLVFVLEHCYIRALRHKGPKSDFLKRYLEANAGLTRAQVKTGQATNFAKVTDSQYALML